MQSLIQGFRLSPQQEHLCRIRRPGQDTGWAVLGLIEIDETGGALDPLRLRYALERTIARHEILRTTFQWLPGMSLPLQVVSEGTSGYTWTEHDLSDLAAPDREVVLQKLAEEAREKPFDLTGGPLLRAALARVEEQRLLLLLALPALAADPASMRNLTGEIAVAYGEDVPGEDREDPLQYADAAEILHEWLSAPEAKPESPAWNGLRAPLRGTAGPSHPRTVRAGLARERSPEIAELAGSLGAPVSLLLLAAWTATLWHTTGESEIVVGTAFDGRTCLEMEEALGLFARYLPVPCEAGPASTLRDLVAALAPRMAEMTEAQDGFPLEAWEHLLAGGEEAAAWPFGFDCARPAPSRGLAPRFLFRGGYAEIDRFEIRLSAFEGDPLRFELHYDPLRSSGEEAERLLGRFVRVLEEMTTAPDLPLAEIDVLGPDERRELVETFNRTARPFPADRCLPELFEKQVRLTPEATALVAGDERLTFAELSARANCLAHHLAGLGVGPESLVGLCLERSPDLVTGLLATLKAGGAYVPLDPGYPVERLAFLMQDAGIGVLLTQERLLRRLPPPPPACRVLCLDGEREQQEIARRPATAPPAADPGNPAYVIYTSGSTGRPKGVVVPHRGLVNYLCWARDAYGVAAGQGAPVHSAIGFDLTVTSLLAPLVSGAAVTLLPDEQGVGALAAALRGAPGFSLVKITPAHLEVLRQVLAPEEAAGAARALVIGGDALTAESLAFWRKNAPDTRLINEYGPTETVVGCCVYEVRPGDPSTGPVPIGRPIANTRLYVMGPGLRQVVAGLPGELWIGGAGVARGYHGRPELTAERFVPDPFGSPGGEPGARAYRTGDLVRLRPDGEIEFLGRIDDQVKVRGFRIEPGEIEAALASHPGVREAVVAARGRGADAEDRRLIAWFVPCEPLPSASSLRSFLGAKLPEHMVPAVFVPLESLPLTAHGKVDRRALPEPPARGEDEAVYAMPRTLEEDLMAEILAGVLGVERIGIDDNFFSLGGDSIRSMRVLSLTRERGLTLSLQELFRYPTIRGLAPFLRTAAAEAEARTEPFSLLSPADRERLPGGLEDAYPLSRLQAGMLFHSADSPDSAIYHDLHSFHLRGVLERELLQAAVDRVVRRHPVLRTSFDLSSFGEPVELVHADVRLKVTAGDLRHLPADQQSAEVGAWLDAERHRGFDWALPPLVRFHVHLRSAETFQFTLSFHHSVLDGWSAASLLTELFRIYTELLAGVPQREEPAPQASFRDFIALERRTLASVESQDFWRRQLEGATLSRVARWPGPASPRQAGDHILPVPAGVAEGLRRLARSVSVPLKSVLLAAHLKVMSVWTGLSDVTTGMVVNGRPEWGDGDRVLGLFLNTVPFRFHLGRETWEELAHRAFELEWAMLPHRRFPLANLQTMQGGRPLFETLFNFLHFHIYQEARQALGGLAVLERSSYEEMDIPLGCNFQLDPGGSQLLLRLNYVTGELTPEQVAAMADCYARLLADMAEAPARRHLEAPVLSAAERGQVLSRWSDGGPAAGPVACLHELFEAQAARTPHRPALVGAGRTLTYAELDAAAAALSRRLRALGAGPERLVGLCAGRGPGLVVGALAILKAGSAYVPLDPAYPAERLAFTLSDSGARVLLTERSLLATLPSVEARIVCLDEDGEPSADPTEEPEVSPDHLAYVIYTSGSTGRPKGVAIPHRAAAALVSWAVSVFPREDFAAVLASTSLCFDLSVFEIFVPLACGGTVVLAENALALQDWQETGVTLVNTVPSAMAELLRMGGLPDSVRAVGLAGEPLQRPLVDAIHAASPAGRVYNLYGPSEDTTYSTWALMRRGDPLPPPIGGPVAGGRVYILDEQLGPLPAGVTGEVWLGGAGLARGYLGRPDLTAERFLPSPYSDLPGERLYRTGDLGRFRLDGEIELLGRIDHQLKVRGYRIEPGEIEAVLVGLAGVREAVVVPREDAPGNRRLVAYFVGDVTADALRRSLRERLPDYMVPATFVALPELPLTPNGKVDRRALPAPEPVAVAVGEHRAAATRVEEVLARIWAEVLRVEQVGVHDDFFALGGDSILSIQICARAQRAGVRIRPRLLFQHPTVAELAAVVDTADAVETEQGLVTGPAPLTPIQAWFFADDPAEPHHFNQSVLFETARRIDPALLASALGRLERHHDALRLRFVRTPAGWQQTFGLPVAPVPLTVVDLAALPAPARPRAVTAAAAQAQASLDLERGPLHRVLSLDLGPQEPGRFFWAIHHLAVDGVSWRFLLEDLAELYGGGAELPLKTTSFRQWAERLAGHADAPETEAELAHWLDQPWTAAARLPLDQPEGLDANTVASEQKESLLLEAEETRALLQEVPQTYNTRIDDVLLTALARGFRDWTGSPVLLVDLEGHGREEIFPDLDLSRTAGWFTSLYPVLLDLREADDPGAALKAIKEQLRKVPRKGVGYGLLRRASRHAAELAALPSPEVVFNYLGQLDQGLPADSFFRPAREAAGAPHSPLRRRDHLLVFNGSVFGGRLGFTCTFSANVHRPETIHRLVEAVTARLRELIAHCRQPETGGYTPSDFPLAGLSAAQLEKILATKRKVKRP